MSDTTVINFPTNPPLFPEYIPQELKDAPRWVVWQWIKRGDKVTKPPFQLDGKAASPTDPETWTEFDKVVERFNKGGVHGIGIVLTSDDDLYAYDLDHCMNPANGKLEPWAEELILKLNSYTEVTPSGDGLRVIVRGDVPVAGKKKTHLSSHDGKNVGAIECYKDRRYITVTGNHYPNFPLSVNAGSVEVWNEVFKNTEKKVSKTLVKNEKFKKLWEGDLSDYDGDHSAADLALCHALAELSDGDPKRIDALFRESKLIRPKWDTVHHGDGSTYGAKTIQIAVASYRNNHNLTDTGDAKRFAKLVKDELHYCNGQWYIWDGKRYAVDELQTIYLYIDRLVDAVVEDAKNAATEDRKKQLIQHARSLESRGRTEAVLKLAQAREPIPLSLSELDSDHLAFNCLNGVVKDGSLYVHSRETKITKLAPVEFQPTASAPTWKAFLKSAIVDDDKIEYLARAVGYSLTGLTTEQVIFFMYGLGANGKSTFANAVLAVLGEYARSIPTELLMVGRDNHPTGLSDLRGVRFALASEIEEGRRWNEQLIKTLTGGEKIVARRMYQDFFEFDSTAKLWVMGNHKPHIRGTDYAIRRRFHLIPFTQTFTKAQQDPTLPEKLKKEYGGILNWILEGYADWKRQGLNPPESIKSATESYFDEMDVIQQFLEEECSFDKSAKASHGELFDRYVSLCKRRNENPLSSRGFSQKLQEKGYKKLRSTGGQIFWQGISLKKDQERLEIDV
jgi:putative DNA primase/helicase